VLFDVSHSNFDFTLVHCNTNREKILSTAKALVEDTKHLVAGAASGQEKLAGAAQSASQTITKLANVVKLGATSLGSDDPDTQVGDFLGWFPLTPNTLGRVVEHECQKRC